MLIRALIVFVLALLASTRVAFPVDFHYSTLQVNVHGVQIPVYVYKPTGKGPFPLIVLSDGSPRLPRDRAFFDSSDLEEQALAFVDMGAVAAVVLRRGYGGHGRWMEWYQTNCSHPTYYDAGLVSAQDIDAGLKTLVKDPDIDHSRVVLFGYSAGGFASVAASTRENVLGVVSFAGGRGSLSPDEVTCKDNLISAMRDYGRASHAPQLWIYSTNDHFFGPSVAAALHDAFVAGGGHATLVTAPPYRNEGHAYVYDVADWKPQVETFLRQIGFLRE